MKTYEFTKRNGQWYISLPMAFKEYNQTDYTKVEDTGGALDTMARGRCTINIRIDTKPIKNAAVLELEELSYAKNAYGYYRLSDGNGKPLKRHLELSDLSLLMFGELPERIYLRKINA